jgi:hypothetical protein
MGDNVTIRFFTDNPGPWFFHCHIDWHLGAYVFSFDPILTQISHSDRADLILPPLPLVVSPSSLLRTFLMCRRMTL